MKHYYRGKGWQIPLLGGCYVVGRGLLEAAFHPFIWASPFLSLVAATALGTWIWRRGRRLNAASPRAQDWSRDEGFSLRRPAAHTYYFVPYEYWGVIFALLSLLMDARLRARPIRPALQQATVISAAESSRLG